MRPGDRVVPHVTVATPVLQTAVCDLTSQTPGLELGHRSQAGHILAVNVQLAGLVGEGAEGLDFGLQLREAEMDNLVIDQGLAEGLALAAVLDGLGNAVFQRLDHVGGTPQALFLELQHLHHETGALRANAVALGHAHVVKENLGGF